MRDKSQILKHRRKLCEIFSGHWKLKVSSVSFHPRTYDTSLCYMNLPISLSPFSSIPMENDCYSLSVRFCKHGMFRTVLRKHKTFRPRISSYYTGLSPRSLRRARSGKYDPTSFEREIGPRSFSISAINRNFLLPRCSEQLGSRYQFSRCIVGTMLSPCSFTILNFNERHFYRLKSRYFLCENSMAVHYSQYLICSRFSLLPSIKLTLKRNRVKLTWKTRFYDLFIYYRNLINEMFLTRIIFSIRIINVTCVLPR